jgi:tetratricopeptide (TPR) repeat protein
MPGVSSFQLYPVSSDTMVSKGRLGQIVFVTDTDGHATKCIPHFADNIGRFPAEEIEAIKMSEEERTPLEILLSGDVADAISMYREHKQSSPEDPDISENRFNRLGYQYLSQNRVDDALAVFELNTRLYPESGNCWDSYGEALAAAGRKEEALRQYQKALELDPSNGNAASWIEKLKSEI